MSLDTNYDDTEEETDDDSLSRRHKPGKREREEIRLREEAETRASTAERRLAFLEAGIPNTAKFSYFKKGYDGEMTAEAIKAAAIEAELLEAEKQVSDEELAAHSRAQQASAGSAPADSRTPGPGSPEYLAALQKATNQDEALEVMRQFGVPIAE